MEYRKEIDNSIELAKWYDEKYTEMGDGWSMPTEVANAHLDDLGVPFDRKIRLLDVGCGAGHFLVEADKRCTATGIDISQVGIGYCRKRNLNVYCDDIAIPQAPTFANYFNYVVSIGSLEHVVDLDKALDNIRTLLKDDGKFYFYCPNEKWKHFDQPNERTMTDEEWEGLFVRHGLFVHSTKRWNDSTVFIGGKTAYALPIVLPPRGNKLCCGSGQKPYEQANGWINIDINPKWKPDIVADWRNIGMIVSDSVEIVVAEQSVEHVGCGEANPFFKESYRVLKPGGSLILTMPNLRALAERWLSHQIDDYIYSVNLYGAFMNHESDRHRWNTSREGWHRHLMESAPWAKIIPFDFRQIPGSRISADWWILGMEAIK